MKKKYEKPTLIIENFELTQHIASCGPQTDSKVLSDLKPGGSCSVKLYFGTKAACDASDKDKTSEQDKWPEGEQAFSSGNKACITETDAYCYTTGAANTRIFGS